MSLLSLWISSPDTHSERRIGNDILISQLKLKLEPITGIPYDSQSLTLRRTSGGAGHSGVGGPGQGEVLAVLDDNNRTLESYGVRDWMTIRVHSFVPGETERETYLRILARSNRRIRMLVPSPGNSPTTRKSTSSSSRKKSTKRAQVSSFASLPLTPSPRADSTFADTVLSYKMRHQLGRFAPTAHSSASSSHSLETSIPKNLVPGARCEVVLSSELSRRGTVRFVGPTEFGLKDHSIWVGVEWDEPVGKNDGQVDDQRYFQTQPLRASFVRPDKVTVGDFPEIDPFAEDDEMEM
ncbi:SPOSA6832_00652, partial [Sporobolomyces salmonicolor]